MAADPAQHVPCPACGQRYPWRDRLASRKLRCICGAKFRMPREPARTPTLIEPRPDPTGDEPAKARPKSSTSGADAPRQPKRRAPAPAAAAPVASEARGSSHEADGPLCPSCERRLRAGIKLCVDCGIDIHTGRSIITSQQVNENLVHANAEPIIRGVSFLVPLGFYPLASEAFGTKTPWTIRTVAVLTVLVSIWFLAFLWTGSEGLRSYKQLMLWPQGEPTAAHVRQMYVATDYGDTDAIRAEVEAIAARDEQDQQDQQDDAGSPDSATAAAPGQDADRPMSEEERLQRMLESMFIAGALRDAPDDTVLEAHANLPIEARAVGEFRWYQMLTHALLHGGIMHLAGNMLFLLVFGLRVNALVGNLGTLALYPLLGVAAAAAHLISTAGEPPVPMLGASGAIWGLAGMYLVLFPVHRVYNALWFRWPLFPLVFLMRLHMKIFACRGFWIVLLFISFDVVSVVMGWRGATAHWAHLGGFLAGVTAALVLLTARVIDANGGDVLSVTLGKAAWFIIGSPAQRAERARSRAPAA